MSSKRIDYRNPDHRNSDISPEVREWIKRQNLQEEAQPYLSPRLRQWIREQNTSVAK